MIEIPAEVIWLPTVTSSFITRQIKELFGAELLVRDELQSSEDEEPFVTVFGKLKLQQFNLKLQQFELLINRWCKQETGKYEKLLSLDKEIIFYTHRTLDDKWIDVANMSFGTMVGLNKFAEHYSTEEQNSDHKLKSKVANIEVHFQHDIKIMSVHFHVAGKNIKAKQANACTHRPHRFEFYYQSINKVLINKTSESKHVNMYFYTSHPPLMYIVELPKDAENKSYENFINQSPDTTYSRVDTFTDCSPSDIGLSTVLKLQFSSKDSWDAICNFALNSKTTKFYFSPILKLPKKNNYHSPKISVDKFNCTYALQCLLSRSRDVVVQIDERQEMSVVNNKLDEFANKDPEALENALFNILASFEQKKIVNFRKALDDHYCKHNAQMRNNNKKLSIPNHLVFVRRAILTPTRIILLQPQPYFRCRFFRDFESEYTIRLSVKDDNIGNLSFTLFGRPSSSKSNSNKESENNTENAAAENNTENAENNTEECDNNLNKDNESYSPEFYCNVALDKIKKRLLKGFKVGKRHYEVLGCSTSHFREHGILFYAKDSNGKNAESVRKDVGDFTKTIKIPSKYMARLGQIFSQSLGCIEVSQKKIKIEDDKISSPNEGVRYIFSDGIGKISPSIAQEAFKELDIKYNPSAIQIRYAGCKGVLTQWPEMKDQIIFRESMKKFESKSVYLEILKTSKPRPVFLNRPLITILSQMGIPDEKFLKLQENILEALFNSLFCKKEAIRMLNIFSLLRIDYKSIEKAGINVLEEPFFLLMIKAIFEHQVAKLATKARILIPPNKGRTMFGVLDETETLEYGQIFVQYTDDIDDEKEDTNNTILTGIVLVTKNPCMHPGDVRKFEAVDVEALHNIKDCIVFPAKGDRPHPDEMAGSDLDGDEYSVIWDEELIFTCDNYDPMNFPENNNDELDTPTTVSDMINFFCKYLSGGQVGQIAAAHLVWADYNSDEEGIFSKRCKSLAHKYSVALDFAKCGKTECLNRDERPDYYPDFLDKGLHNNTYLSKNVLGQLYRGSKIVQLGFEGLVCTATYDADEDLNYPGHENYKEAAKKTLCMFNNEVDVVLQQYGIRSEGELFSGAIMKTSKYICVKQDLNDLSVIEHRIKHLFKEMQKEFSNEFSNNDERIICLTQLIYGKHKEQVFQKASAWYMVTCEQSLNEKRYFGLPWTVHEILCRLKEERKRLKKLPMLPRQFEIRMITENFPNEIHNLTNNHAKNTLKAFDIMNEWMIQQLIIYSNDEKEEYDYLLMKIFKEITDDLEKQNGNEELSVFRIILKYLHKLSCLIFRRAEAEHKKQQHNSHFLKDQIIGLLAFKTFLNIQFRHEFNFKSIIEADMEPCKEVFRIPLDEESIFRCISHRREEVNELLKEWTKVDEIEFRLKADRRNKWYILFTVTGNKYALHQFQDTIFQKNFGTALKEVISFET